MLVRERRPLAGGLRPGEGPRGRGWRGVGAGLEAPGMEAARPSAFANYLTGSEGGEQPGNPENSKALGAACPGP